MGRPRTRSVLKNTSQKKEEFFPDDDIEVVVSEPPELELMPVPKAVVGSESSYFADLDDADLDADYDTNLIHPAELAAQGGEEESRTGGDEQILKDLRRQVFSVPLLHQAEICRLFDELDKKVFPMCYRIIETSDVYFEKVMQILIKVAAGNTYGKNLYDRQGNEIKGGTYKNHEIDFMQNSHDLFVLFASTRQKPKNRNYKKVISALSQSAFIRGVYEELLADFCKETKFYTELHWLALAARLKNNIAEYNRLTTIIKNIDENLKLTRSAYFVARESQNVNLMYTTTRSTIIAPYLRTVYSLAKRTAKNAHQMLENFQNGALGLVRAVSCYSVKRSSSFSAVAKWWVKQMMLLSIKEGANFIKLPVSTWQAYTQLEKAKNKLGALDEDIEKIAAAAKMSVKKAKTTYDTVKITQVYSLNKTYDTEERLSLEDIISEENKLFYASEDDLDNVLRFYCKKSDLSEIESKVLALRFGMLDILKGENLSVDDVKRETIIQNLSVLGYGYKFS